MAILIALVVAAGFGPTYASSLPPPGLPWWVHLHGAAMTGWIALFAVQAWLVKRRSLSFHRRLGWAALALAAAIVPLGCATTILAAKRGATPPFFTPAAMMSADMVDVVIFAGLVASAIVLRRKIDWHKRLMLTATVLLSWPALGRLVGTVGHSMTAVIPVSTTLLLLMFDLATRRSVHAAYLYALAAVVLAQPLRWLVAHSLPMSALASWAVHWSRTNFGGPHDRLRRANSASSHCAWPIQNQRDQRTRSTASAPSHLPAKPGTSSS